MMGWPLYFGYWMSFYKDFSYDDRSESASYACQEHDYTGAQVVSRDEDAPFNSRWQFDFDASGYTNLAHLQILDYQNAAGGQLVRDPRPWTLWAICRLLSRGYLVMPSFGNVIKDQTAWPFTEERVLPEIASRLAHFAAFLEPFADAFPVILIADEPVKGDWNLFDPDTLNQIATGFKYFQGTSGARVFRETPVMYNHYALDAVWRHQPPIPTHTDFVSSDPYLGWMALCHFERVFDETFPNGGWAAYYPDAPDRETAIGMAKADALRALAANYGGDWTGLYYYWHMDQDHGLLELWDACRSKRDFFDYFMNLLWSRIDARLAADGLGDQPRFLILESNSKPTEYGWDAALSKIHNQAAGGRALLRSLGKSFRIAPAGWGPQRPEEEPPRPEEEPMPPLDQLDWYWQHALDPANVIAGALVYNLSDVWTNNWPCWEGGCAEAARAPDPAVDSWGSRRSPAALESHRAFGALVKNHVPSVTVAVSWASGQPGALAIRVTVLPNQWAERNAGGTVQLRCAAVSHRWLMSETCPPEEWGDGPQMAFDNMRASRPGVWDSLGFNNIALGLDEIELNFTWPAPPDAVAENGAGVLAVIGFTATGKTWPGHPSYPGASELWIPLAAHFARTGPPRGAAKISQGGRP